MPDNPLLDKHMRGVSLTSTTTISPSPVSPSASLASTSPSSTSPSSTSPSSTSTSSASPPDARFDALFAVPELADLALLPIWTVSGQPDVRYRHGDGVKVPLNVSSLTGGHPFGAKPDDPDAVTDIETLRSMFDGRMPPNLAMFWNYDRDGLVLLDVESHASPEVLRVVPSLPSLYAEASLSGIGRHLVMALPEDDDRLAVLRRVTTLRGPNGDWELHLRHWVTFTGNAVPSHPTDRGNERWLAMLDALLEHAHASNPSAPIIPADIQALEANPPAFMDEVILSFRAPLNRPRKGRGDFLYATPQPGKEPWDASRLEIHCLDHYAMLLARDMARGCFVTIDGERVPIPDDLWSDDEVAYILWKAAERGDAGFQRRAKHEEVRLGQPFLLYRAQQAVQYAREKLAERVADTMSDADGT